MKKHPHLKCKINGTHYFLLKDWQDFMGWVVLIISNSDTITKADKRIKEMLLWQKLNLKNFMVIIVQILVINL